MTLMLHAGAKLIEYNGPVNQREEFAASHYRPSNGSGTRRNLTTTGARRLPAFRPPPLQFRQACTPH
jgi:hypothetical protein